MSTLTPTPEWGFAYCAFMSDSSSQSTAAVSPREKVKGTSSETYATLLLFHKNVKSCTPRFQTAEQPSNV